MFKKINIISEEIFKNTCNKFQLFNNSLPKEIPELHMFGNKSDVSSSTFITWYAGFWAVLKQLSKIQNGYLCH